MVFVLTYFNLRARGELARLICEEGKLNYKNNIVSNWSELKPKTPFGQLPILEVEGKPGFVLAQSVTVARYLAKQANLYPSSDELSSKADMIADSVVDLRSAEYEVFYIKVDRDVAIAKFKETKLAFYLSRFESMLQANGGAFFVGNSISYADLAVFDVLEEVFKVAGELANYPTLKNFYTAIANRPNLSKYINDPNRAKPYGLASL